MSLRNKTIKGLLWNLVSAGGKGGLSMLIMIILSRKLPPSDFALLALILATTSISTIFIDCGFAQAVIKEQQPRKEALSTLFYLNIIVALGIYLGLYVFTPWFLEYFSFGKYVLHVRVAFLILIFDAFVMIQSALFNKALNFKPITLSLLCSSAIAAGAAIVVVYLGGGCWSLVAYLVIASFFRAVLLWYFSKWRPSKRFELVSVKPYFHFGGFLLLSGVLDHICTSLETFIIGRFFTKNDLAFVSRAKDFDAQVNQAMLPLFMKVIYPALSTLQDDENRVKNVYRKALCTMQFLTFPLVCLMIASADNLVVVLFGQNWAETAIYLRIICIFALFFPAQVLCSNIFLIKNRTRLYFTIGFFKQIVRVGVLAICCHYNILILVYGMTFVGVGGAIVLIIFSSRLISYSFKEICMDFFPTFIIGTLAATATFLIGSFYSGAVWQTLVIQIVIMTLIYGLLSLLSGSSGFIYIKDILIEKLRSGGKTLLSS